MSVTKPFHDARERLGLGPNDDATAVKRAWRRAAAASPPDRDPEGFRQAREAYELLSDPYGRAADILCKPMPLVPIPSMPALPPSPPPHALAVEMLRNILGRLPLADLRAPERSVRNSQPPAEGEP